jgi:hypothetical protein
MTTGVLETKGTKLYFVGPGLAIEKVACATGISGLSGAGAQIDTTCLDSAEKEFARGMLAPGQLSVPINFIPTSTSHQALTELKDSGDLVSWMIVFSDQTLAVTELDSDDRLVSPGPTSVEFLGYVADFAIDIATDSIVKATLTLQRSGAPTWDFPAPTQP